MSCAVLQSLGRSVGRWVSRQRQQQALVVVSMVSRIMLPYFFVGGQWLVFFVVAVVFVASLQLLFCCCCRRSCSCPCLLCRQQQLATYLTAYMLGEPTMTAELLCTRSVVCFETTRKVDALRSQGASLFYRSLF